MKKIKLSGREVCVVRAIDFSLGASGTEICERTLIQCEDLLDILNGLMETGYIETNPPVEKVEMAAFEGTKFEINPSYTFDLKEAILRR